MKPQIFRCVPRLLPLAAVLLTCGVAQAAQPPRVMFVSGVEAQPVLVDLQGKEIPAKKGQVIPPGFSVKVPNGATVQIMTDEKAIVAVRQNSLLKLEKLGDGNEPHKFKLDIGGLRVANSEKKPHKFEVDTPNAKIRFDKGDHEAYYFKEGKIPDKWGTFTRVIKEDLVLTTDVGDTKITTRDVGYVRGTGSGRPELLARVDASGRSIVDPVSYVPGSSPDVLRDINANQRALAEKSGSPASDPASPGAPGSRSLPGAASPLGTSGLGRSLAGTDKIIAPIPNVKTNFQKIDPVVVSRLNPNTVPDPNKEKQIRIATLPSGEKIGIEITPQAIGIMTTDPNKTASIPIGELQGRAGAAPPPPAGGGSIGRVTGIDLGSLNREVQKATAPPCGKACAIRP